MWELQPLSTNKRITEIFLLLEENTSLTISQIPHNFVGLLSYTLSPSCSLVSLLCCNIYGKDALPIYRQSSLPLSCKKQEQGKWHQLVLQVAPNWCPLCWLSLHQLVPASFTYLTSFLWYVISSPCASTTSHVLVYLLTYIRSYTILCNSLFVSWFCLIKLTRNTAWSRSKEYKYSVQNCEELRTSRPLQLCKCIMNLCFCHPVEQVLNAQALIGNNPWTFKKQFLC